MEHHQMKQASLRQLEKMLIMRELVLFSIFFCGFVCSKEAYDGIEKFADVYTLPSLSYGYNDLEPYIDAATLRVHHTGHHQGYTNKMNNALQKWRSEAPDSLSASSILKILGRIEEVPDKYRTSVRNTGGGFVNHAIYFAVMSPNTANETRQPEGQILQEIEKSFATFDNFKAEFTNKAASLFGSGYTWLCQRPSIDGSLNLVVMTTINQDIPYSEGYQPILTLDVWEHAYYLKHQLRRANHISDWWRIVDWKEVEKLSKWWQQVVIHDEL